MKKHIRYVVKTENGYIKKRDSSHFQGVELSKADLYLSKYQAERSAERHGGGVRRVEIKEIGEE